VDLSTPLSMFVAAVSWGQQWYEDGKFLKKKNTFNDYLDACDALLKLGYGSPSLCYAMGGSAGGSVDGRCD